jgi:hypothetical protein
LAEIFKRTALTLRELGFRGSGQTYRKRDGEYVFIVNFQRSRWGDAFFVNLGAQPSFVPAEIYSTKTLQEVHCIWRRRVGEKWPYEMSEAQFQSFLDQVVTTQHAFFEHATTFPAALSTETPEVLLKNFSAGTTQARSSLHLAHAALALKYPDVAAALATLGLGLAGDAHMLRRQLEQILDDARRAIPTH